MALMFKEVLCVALLFVGVAGSTLEAEAAKKRPVSKVITLLKDIVAQLDKEAEEDKEVFEEFGCWCETGFKGKTLAISNAEENIGTLGSSIEESASNAARLKEEVKTLEKEVAANKEALDSATAMRQKELAEFSSEEKDAVSTIASLGGAIGALTKSESAASLLQVATTLRRHSDAVPAVHRELVDAFLLSAPEGATAFLQKGMKSAPASSAITGVLKGMKESFENNLGASQKEESTDQADYEALKAAKTSEIDAGTNLIEIKTQELADAETKQAQDEQDKKDTERALAADKEYLANLKEKCAGIDEEFEARTKNRQQEILAVSKALEYLSSDEASDLFSRTLSSAAAFLQVRQRARIPLGSEVAGAEGAPVEGGEDNAKAETKNAFANVENSVGDMVSKLTADKEEEMALKDYCIDSLQKNEAEIDAKKRVEDTLQEKIANHVSAIKKALSEVEVLKNEIHESRVALKHATEDREKANKDFQTTVADQRATANLLKGALNILKSFYDKAALVQAAATTDDAAPAGAPPPSGFKKAAPAAASGGVMGMIEQIIKDAEAMVEEALEGEKSAQEAYESLVTETNAAIVAMQKSIAKKTEVRSEEEAEKVQKDVELKGIQTEIAELQSTNKDLHEECDFTLANFDVSQKARGDEIYGLKEAIAIVAGQKYAKMKGKEAGI